MLVTAGHRPARPVFLLVWPARYRDLAMPLATRSFTYLSVLSSVVVLVGCYNLTLSNYNGGDGGQGTGTNTGVGTGVDAHVLPPDAPGIDAHPEVVTGGCPAGSHDDGTGHCVQTGCAADFFDPGNGTCRAGTPASLTASPTTLSLGSVGLGESSPEGRFTITNTGQTPSGKVTVSSSSNEFVVSTGTAGDCGPALSGGASCTVRIVFDPAASGDRSADVTFSASPGNGGSVRVSGSGLSPAALSSGTTTELSFGSIDSGSASDARSFTITNTGQQTSGSVSVTSDSSEFAIQDPTGTDCDSGVTTLAPGGSCTVRIVFTPNNSGARSGTVSFSAAPGGSGSVSVTGTSLLPAALSSGGTSSLSFGSIPSGTSSRIQSFTITNTGEDGSGAICLTSSNSEFGIQSPTGTDCVSCVTTLAAGASCTVHIMFTPSVSGARSGSISFSATPGGSGSVSVSGTSLSPAALSSGTTSLLSFGVVTNGLSSTVQSFTITNTGQQSSGAVSVTSNNSEFAIQSPGSTDCVSGVTTLAPGAYCAVRIVFTPSAIGARSGSISFSATPGGSGTVSVSGTSVSSAYLSSGGTSSLSFGQVSIGSSSAVQSFTITNTGRDISGAISLALVGGAFAIRGGLVGDCVSGVTTLAGGAYCTARIVFTPSSSGSFIGSVSFSATPGGGGSVSLYGTALSPASLTSGGTSSLSFGTVPIGTSSAVQSFVIENTGQDASGAIVLTSDDSEFVIQGGLVGDCLSGVTTLAAGFSCTVRIVFTPSVTGARSGSISFSATPGGSGTVIVYGTALSPATLTSNGTSSLSFGTLSPGTSSYVQGFTISNTGQDSSGAITLTSNSSDFVIQSGLVGDCVSGMTTLAAGASCNVSIVFTPAALGARSGTVTFTATPGGSGSVSLSGTCSCPVDTLANTTGTCVPIAGVVWTQRASSRSWFSVASSSDGTKLVTAAYGGYIYTSTDSGATWTQRGSQQGWQAVASSSDGAKLVAVANYGYIYTSTDSGLTWTQRGSQQDWQAVASSSDGTKLVAAVYNGLVYTSADSGLTWTQRASQQYWWSVASSSDGTSLVAVANSGYIYISTNSGMTWAQRASQQNWQSVASSSDGAKLVAAGSGYIYTSADSGLNWTQPVSPQVGQSVASSSDGTKLVAVSYGSTCTSIDSGATWTPGGSSGGGQALASSSDGSKLVTVGSNGYIGTSTDLGVTWTERVPSQSWRSVASSTDGSKLVAVAYGGYIYTSMDSGVTWTQRASEQSWYSVASSSDGIKLVAVACGGYIYTSTDSGATWMQQGSQQGWYSVASSSDGSKLVAVAYGGYIYTSTDSGGTWTQQGTSQSWFSVASSSDGMKLVAVAYNGYIYTSTDSGATWTPQGSSQYWRAVASSSDGTKLVAVSDGGTYTSTNSGATWTPRASSPSGSSVASSSDGTKLVVGWGSPYTSTDSGATWTSRSISGGSVQALASSADGTKLVAVCYDGSIYTSTGPVP